MKLVVMVNDEARDVADMRKILKGKYELKAFPSWKAAQGCLVKHKPDIFLVNMNTLNPKGYGINRKTPIVCIVSDISTDIEEECIKSGAAEIIIKPFSEKVIEIKLNRIIELNNSRKTFETLVMKKTEQIFQMQHRILTSFAKMIEYKDGMTGGHVIRTSGYVEIIANELKADSSYQFEMTDDFLKDVIQSAPLHDIGKIGISDMIILKPTLLTDEEFEIMRSHTICGNAIIEEALTDIEGDSYLNVAKDMALYHHEKWDGSGYPTGLSGTDIPLSARIMAVADVFDSLVSARTYKNAYSYDRAFEIIEIERGQHFDPVIVDAFLNRRQEIIDYGTKIGNGDIATFNSNSVIEQYLSKIKHK